MHVGILERVDGQPLELLVGAFTASPVPKVILTLAEGEVGRFVAANQAFGDLLGYDRHELIGQSSQIVVAPEDRDAVSDVFEGMIAGRIREAVVERVLVRRDGSRVWISSRNFLAHDRSGASFLIAEIVDSSSRQALADSEAWFRSLVDASPIGMAVLDGDGRWTRVNPAVSALLGYTGDELAGLTLSGVTHPGDRDADGPVPDDLASGAGRQVTRRLLRKDGQVLYCLVTVTVLTAESGVPVRFLAQIVDVTAGRRSQELLDVMITASPDLLALTTLDGTVLRVNAAWQQLLGWSEDELTGTRLADLRHPEDTGAGATSGEGTYRYRAKDGRYRWVQWSGRVVPDQQVIMGTGRDVTDAIVAEQSAARETDRLRTTIRVQREITAVAADRDAVLRLISDRTLEVISTGEAAAVHLTDPGGRTMRMVAGTGDLAGRDVPAVALSGSIIGTAAASGVTVRCDDTAVDPRASHSLSRTIGMRSLVVAPLRTAGGAVFGALLVASARPGAFDDGDEQLLTLLADAVTGALRHAEETAARAAMTDAQVRRLKDTLQVQREVTAAAADRQAAMHTVARRAVDLFPAADGSAVELLEDDHLSYVAAAGTLARFPDSADSPAENAGPGSVLEVPLHAGGTPIGFLKISAERPDAFDDSDEQQLSLLADSLSSALRHADDAAHTARALAELAVSENRFRLTFDNSPVGLTLSSLQPGELGRYLHANAAMSAITGYSSEELSRMTYADLQHPDDVASTDEYARRLRSGEIDTVILERRYRHRQGHTIWVALRVAVVRDDDGNARYVVNQVEDITARRAADAELRRQARLLELIPAAVIVRDLDGTIRWWNARATELYGWPLTAATGKTADRLLATGYAAHSTAAEQRDRLEHDGRWEGRLQHVTADGRLLTVMSRQVLHQPEPGPDGHLEPVQVLEINSDVTAARAAEIALADSEQRLRAQFDNSAAGQVIRALDGTLTAVNRAYAGMLGHTADELTGRPEAELLDPAEVEENRHLLAGLFAGDADSYTREGRLRHADGHRVDVEATVSLVRDDTGRPKHLIGVVTDISGRRAAERARDNAAASLAERNTELEAANQLKLDIIGMLGHEIGNPLTTIQGQAEILADDWARLDDSRRGRAIDAIGRQAARLDDIVREVLAMVTIDAGSIRADRRELSVRAQIDSALASFLTPEPLPVHGDDAQVLFAPGHLQQILVNLLSNAAKYGGGATAVRIARSDGWVHVTVEDSGPGVPEQFRDRLFDRLTRAERDATTVKGTGLGLYIVRGLARANHGDVHHEPNPAGGSRFILDLEATP
ncbi:PAS domain S-box protein [Actinoplanes sp. NPDC026670]|uniref:PAS domain S-box protein n=1 Tax=Actinoplanes sp. NPDC026670 TaxID=3154700 RepID=UPI00340B97BE